MCPNMSKHDILYPSFTTNKKESWKHYILILIFTHIDFLPYHIYLKYLCAVFPQIYILLVSLNMKKIIAISLHTETCSVKNMNN